MTKKLSIYVLTVLCALTVSSCATPGSFLDKSNDPGNRPEYVDLENTNTSSTVLDTATDTVIDDHPIENVDRPNDSLYCDVHNMGYHHIPSSLSSYTKEVWGDDVVEKWLEDHLKNAFQPDNTDCRWSTSLVDFLERFEISREAFEEFGIYPYDGITYHDVDVLYGGDKSKIDAYYRNFKEINYHIALNSTIATMKSGMIFTVKDRQLLNQLVNKANELFLPEYSIIEIIQDTGVNQEEFEKIYNYTLRSNRHLIAVKDFPYRFDLEMLFGSKKLSLSDLKEYTAKELDEMIRIYKDDVVTAK